ncbi:multiubiquitin [Roseimicrobium gellanilyticum]|uniref:Multiubiquitin n=1 Tax=Roseimicrobium gellanilyticum TaxID=748857 RepID=A0A366HBA0_9BACT|nr:multiubiquitin domain-containing protein [Roseimicrobium gellanilyticum]RBP39631.1 multiubiquitin [Roseimicrobium gellanilyticum]
MNTPLIEPQHPVHSSEDRSNSQRGAKWFAHINDVRIPTPQRRVLVKVLKTQGNSPEAHALVRDHNSPEDPVFADDAVVDLAQGNVFYSVPLCDLKPRGQCTAPPKLAYSVDDGVEITIRPDQSGRTVRDWFGLDCQKDLFRDYESPHDSPIEDGDSAFFGDGPVFYTRQTKGITIVINGRERVVTSRLISYEEVVQLGIGSPDPNTAYTVTYSKGPDHKPKGTMVAGDVVKVKCGMNFNVRATDRS